MEIETSSKYEPVYSHTSLNSYPRRGFELGQCERGKKKREKLSGVDCPGEAR